MVRWSKRLTHLVLTQETAGSSPARTTPTRVLRTDCSGRTAQCTDPIEHASIRWGDETKLPKNTAYIRVVGMYGI